MQKALSILVIFLGLIQISIAQSVNQVHQFKFDQYTVPTNKDQIWPGKEYWSSSFEEWKIRNGFLRAHSKKHQLESLCSLTRRINTRDGKFEMNTDIHFETLPTDTKDVRAGFLLASNKAPEGEKAPAFISHQDVAKIFFIAGVSSQGQLFIKDPEKKRAIVSPKHMLGDKLKLTIKLQKSFQGYRIILEAFDLKKSQKLNQIISPPLKEKRLSGLIGLFTRSNSEKESVVAFKNWSLTGDKVDIKDEYAYGPFAGTLYTLSNSNLRLNAQLFPLDDTVDPILSLQINEKGYWKTVQQKRLDPESHNVQFHVKQWPSTKEIPYRVVCKLRESNHKKANAYYNGVIRQEPLDKGLLRIISLSQSYIKGNAYLDYQTQYIDPVKHIQLLQPDHLAFTGRIVPKPSTSELKPIAYLHQWCRWLWVYGDLFRNRPMFILPSPLIQQEKTALGSIIRKTQFSHLLPVNANIKNYALTYSKVGLSVISDQHSPDGLDFIKKWSKDWSRQEMKLSFSDMPRSLSSPFTRHIQSAFAPLITIDGKKSFFTSDDKLENTMPPCIFNTPSWQKVEGYNEAAYAMIKVDLIKQEYSFESWPLHVHPHKRSTGRLPPEWPVTFPRPSYIDKRAAFYLPIIETPELSDPVIEVYKNGDFIYALRFKGHRHQPRVFSRGSYTVIVGEQGSRFRKTYRDLKTTLLPSKSRIIVRF